MYTSIRVLATTLVWTGVVACGQAGRAADTTASTADTAALMVSDTAGLTTQSAGSIASQATVQAPVKSAPVTKTARTPAVRDDAARIAAARADSLRHAQDRAAAMRTADSVKLADAAQATAAQAAAAQPTVPREPVQAPANRAAQGKAPYDANCKKCHGVAGVPPKAMQAKFQKLEAFNAAFFAKRSSDSVVAVLMNGTSPDMKSFKDKLTKDEMVAIAAYMRTFLKP